MRKALEYADLVYLSVFVLAELYVGFKGGSKEKQNRDLLTRFVSRPTVRIVSATQETAEVFAEIKHSLKRAGTPLPLNDVWIAAHALETGSVLATFDSHFTGKLKVSGTFSRYPQRENGRLRHSPILPGRLHAGQNGTDYRGSGPESQDVLRSGQSNCL